MKLLRMRGSLKESKREAMADLCVRAGSRECEGEKRKRGLYPHAPRYSISMFREDNTIKKSVYAFALSLSDSQVKSGRKQ